MKTKWIFADWKLPTQKDLDLISEMGFTDVVLGAVLPKANVFKPSYSEAKITAAAEAIKAIDVRVHVMAWVYRHKAYIRECAKWMIDICKEIEAASGILDAESDWHSGLGISAVDAASLVKQEFSQMPCKLGVTGLSNLHRTVKPLLDVCDFGLPQAYSIWKPGAEEHWSHSRSTEPLTQQLESWVSWSETGKPLVMGLSNYWAVRPSRFQSLPRMEVRTSLTLAIQGAEKSGADDVAYWSLKWLQGNGAERKAAQEIIAAIPIETEESNVAEESESDNQHTSVQWLLKQLGYYLGRGGPKRDGVDGSWGKKSKAAIDKFRKEHNINRTGDYVLEDITALVNTLRKSQV